MNSLGRQFSVASSCASRGLRRKRWNNSALCAAGTRGRSLHTVRELPYPVEEGVGDFLPPAALKTVLEWQQGLLDRLNDQVKDTPFKNESILQTIINTANDAEYIQAFNYASLAANNNFFLNCIKPQPKESNKSNVDEMSMDVKQAIVTQFSDLGMLQERFVASASGMTSSGWLWLVTDGQQQLAVIPTFGSGTLLIRHRLALNDLSASTVFASETRPQEFAGTSPSVASSSQGTATPTSPLSGIRTPPQHIDPHSPARSIHSSALVRLGGFSVLDRSAESLPVSEAQRLKAFSEGNKVYPLFCLSIHEHTWMSAGLGVWGKEEYVRRFFSVLDWKSISATYEKFHTTNYRGAMLMR